MVCRKVVLPEPTRPMTPTSSPFGMATSKCFNAAFLGLAMRLTGHVACQTKNGLEKNITIFEQFTVLHKSLHSSNFHPKNGWCLPLRHLAAPRSAEGKTACDAQCWRVLRLQRRLTHNVLEIQLLTRWGMTLCDILLIIIIIIIIIVIILYIYEWI